MLSLTKNRAICKRSGSDNDFEQSKGRLREGIVVWDEGLKILVFWVTSLLGLLWGNASQFSVLKVNHEG